MTIEELEARIQELQDDQDSLQEEHDALNEMLQKSAVTSLSHRDMIAMTVASGLSGTSAGTDSKWIAERSYEIADALIEERKKVLI